MKARLISRLRLGAAVVVLLGASIRCAAPIERLPLQRFETCEALEDFLIEQMVSPRVRTAQLGGAGFLFGCAADAALGMAPGDQMEDISREYTTTNTLVGDVDEPDFVKNDGDHIYILRRGSLIIADAWPAEAAQVLSSTQISGAPFEMFFAQDRVMVFSRGRSDDVWMGETTTAYLFDVSDKTAPALLRTLELDASYQTARRVGDEVLLVSRAQLRVPGFESAPFSDDKNRERARETGVAGLLPRLRDRIVGVDETSRVEPAMRCDQTWAPSATDGRSLLLVHTLSLVDETAPVSSTGVVSGFSEIYATSNSVYLASAEMSDGGYFTPPFTMTRLHKLSAFAEGGAARYEATGIIDGALLSQFSMDEQDGLLRVVVTENQGTARQVEQNLTSLLVLEQQGDELVEAARVSGIGDGEAVQSVRFFGDRAYVVTYPEETAGNIPTGGDPWVPIIDPLFTIDLSSPKNPRLRGELKVPGFSTYLHPLSEDHLLAIGANTDENNRYLGLSLSLFDVSDPDAPRLAHRHDFGDGQSLSEALREHHAFTYFAREKVLGIPVQSTSTQGVTSTGLEVFRIDVDEGITPLGRVEQRGLFDGEPIDPWDGVCLAVRRSVMIAEGEAAYVYAISAGGMTVARLDEDLPVVAEVPFPEDTVCPSIQVPL